MRRSQQVKEGGNYGWQCKGGWVKVGKGAGATWQMRIQDGFQLPLVANARHPDLREAVGQRRTDLALPKVATCHITSSLSDGALAAIQPQSLRGGHRLQLLQITRYKQPFPHTTLKDTQIDHQIAEKTARKTINSICGRGAPHRDSWSRPGEIPGPPL